MQKTVHNGLIAAAVALGLSGAAAAEMTVYGKIHVSAGAISEDDGTSDSDSTAVTSHASRLGVKADQLLDNGMTMKGQMEFQVDTVGDNAKSSDDLIKARNTYVGLEGGFGEVRVGYHDMPHKMATGKLDPFGDTYADYNNVVQTDTRAKNSILYLNSFNNFSVGLAYAGGDDAVEEENENDRVSAMLSYKGGPLYLTAAREDINDVTDPEATEASTKLGAGFTFGAAKLGLVYDMEERANGDDDTAMFLSGQFKLNEKGTFKTSYGILDYDDGAKEDPTFYALGYNHKMDKAASLYVLLASGDDDGLAKKGKLDGDGSAAVVGMVYKF
ncbi:porin [Thiohalomonas denitrificans]|uniref:Outer membrane protein (Porin) n=1 Tax=Thiohalomonas denitrificans TaxID=415747 RepID=A0A1G5Q5W0_9GAMM|nr:porin [Thiohalomonas denitrificans]SCZ57275.1 Outer membrane protein (porin) [Thiohalomonas denitrificans]